MWVHTTTRTSATGQPWCGVAQSAGLRAPKGLGESGACLSTGLGAACSAVVALQIGSGGLRAATQPPSKHRPPGQTASSQPRLPLHPLHNSWGGQSPAGPSFLSCERLRKAAEAGRYIGSKLVRSPLTFRVHKVHLATSREWRVFLLA